MSAATIREIVAWLRRVEHLANEVYLQAAGEFQGDGPLASFLEHLAEDEAWHYHVMGSAAERLTVVPEPRAAIAVDPATGERILGYLGELKKRLGAGGLPRDELIDRVAELELSEWNDIFLYVVNVMKEESAEFRYPAARIQAHLREIEQFIAEFGEGAAAAARLKGLPPVWVENILIVDDERLIGQVLRRLLVKAGNVDVASNGREALELMGAKFYKVVVSDIDMPVMNGFAFYEEAVRRYSSAGMRFLFMTGDLTPARLRYLQEHGLACLEKPLEIEELQREVMKRIVAK